MDLQELRKSLLFEGVEVSELRRILPQLEKKYYSRGAFVFKEGDPSQTLYLILSGQVKIFDRDEQGRHHVLAYLHAGDFFGETSVVTNETRSVTAEVVIDADILTIRKEIFEEISQKEPRILHNVIRTINQRISLRTKGYVQQSPKAHIIVSVYHPKREIEGTFLVANLAASIAKQTGLRIAVLDLSFRDTNLTKMLNLNVGLEIKDQVITRELVQKMLVPHPSGIDLLALSPELLKEGKMGREKIAQILSILKKTFPYTLINASSEINKNTFEALDLSDKIILLVPLGEESPVTMFDQQEIMTAYYQNQASTPVLEDFLTWSPSLIVDWQPQQLEQFQKTGELVVIKTTESPASQSIHRLARHVAELKIGLALGGVAARGLAHIGVLDVLEQNRIPIDMIAATNTGALIGIAYALGVRSKDLIKLASTLFSSYELGKLLDFRVFQGGLLTNKKVVKLISNFLGESNNFSQLKIPLRIIAMDLETGKDVVFERGSLRNALQAAMAMPGVFPPVQIDGKTFVDGSTVNPVPVSHLIDMYADIVVGVNALPPLKQLPPSGPTYTNRNGEEPGIDLRSISHSTENWKMVDIIMRSFQKLQHEVSLSKANLADLTITPEVTHFNWKDFTKFSDIIDAGRRATEQTIPKLLEILDKRKLYRRS